MRGKLKSRCIVRMLKVRTSSSKYISHVGLEESRVNLARMRLPLFLLARCSRILPRYVIVHSTHEWAAIIIAAVLPSPACALSLRWPSAYVHSRSWTAGSTGSSRRPWIHQPQRSH